MSSEIFFSASQDAQAISTTADIMHITIADDKPIKVWAFEIAQTSDLGDAAEEVLRLGFYRGVTGGGGGSALTEVALSDYNGVTAGTAVVGQGNPSTGGTLVKTFYWNIRQAGPVWVALPETTIRVGQASSACAIRVIAAPSDALTTSYEIIWSEGG